MDDLISRQAAIDALDAIFPVDPTKSEYAQGIACGAALAKTYVGQLPSAQPERKTGRWIESNPQNSTTCRLIKCSECGDGYIVGFNVPYEDWTEAHKFCIECGAKMTKTGKEK